VGIVQCAGYGSDYFRHLVYGHAGWVAICEQAPSVSPVHEIHGDPQLPFVLAAVVYTDDVWMPQCRGQVGFAVESLAKALIVRYVGRQNLDCVHAWQARMLGEIEE
jgi:hypothetical protein